MQKLSLDDVLFGKSSYTSIDSSSEAVDIVLQRAVASIEVVYSMKQLNVLPLARELWHVMSNDSCVHGIRHRNLKPREAWGSNETRPWITSDFIDACK